MDGRKKQRKRRKTRLKMVSRRWRALKTESPLPPNQNLQKFPDETYGDMQLPFSREPPDRESGR